MAGRPRGIECPRDEVTLTQVKILELDMVLECLGCGHKRLMDVDALLRKLPAETTMKKLAKLARCKNRGCRGNHGAEVLFRTGDFPEDWWPRTPANRMR